MDNNQSNLPVEVSKKPLQIFVTDADRIGADITTMSDFFGAYIHETALVLRESSNLQMVSSLPVADLSILGEAINHADVLIKGKITLLPDFDNLPLDIRSKLKRGIYSIGESRQVDGNLRPVILDENGVRIKDITLKRVINNPQNIEAVRSIGNQLQMRQIFMKLEDIHEFQTYDLEKGRDRDIITPFLDARYQILEAETKKDEQERNRLLRGADDKIRTAISAIHADLETTAKRFIKKTSNPFSLSGTINTYISFLASDLQIATKYVGVRVQLLEYLGDYETAKAVLQHHQEVIYAFLTRPVNKKGQTMAYLMHDYFPYTKSNMNCWLNFTKEVTPLLKSSIEQMRLCIAGEYQPEAYIVSVGETDEES